MKLKIQIMLFLVLFLSMNNTVYANSNSLVEKKRNAVVETAEAYYRRGESVQYDVYRENRFAPPEQATANSTIYSVCSSFVQQVYNNTLQSIKMSYPSTNLIKYAQKYYKTTANHYDETITTNDVASGKYILKYYNQEETKAALNNNALSISWSKFLKKGDVFVVYYKTLGMGHTMLVTEINGDNVTLLDNNGYVYNVSNQKYVENLEKNGSINKFTLQQRLSEYKGSAVSEMAIIRYITDDNKYLGTGGSELTSYPLSTAAEMRLLYPKIDISKTARIISDKRNYSSILAASLGDKIEYTITIKNNSNNNYNNIVITEKYSKELVKISSYDKNPTIIENQLIWNNISIPSGTEYKIKYTVKVNSNSGLLGKMITSEGTVGNGKNYIENTKVNHYIGNTLTTSKQAVLKELYNEEKFDNLIERNYINALYKKAFNVDLGLDNLKNSDIMSYCDSACQSGSKLLVANTKLNNTSVKDMVLYNFYGLAVIEGTDNYAKNQTVNIAEAWRYLESKEKLYDYVNRARYINKNMLEIGDIILIYDTKTKTEKDYIYIANNMLVRKINNNEFEILSNGELTKFLRNIIGKNYLILRPALALNFTESGSGSAENEPDIPVVPNIPEKEPETPEKEPEVPEKEPETPEKEPEVPEKEPETPEKEPEVPEKEPETPDKEPEVPEKEPDAPDEEPEVPEKEPNVPETEKNNIIDENKIIKILTGIKNGYTIVGILLSIIIIIMKTLKK